MFCSFVESEGGTSDVPGAFGFFRCWWSLTDSCCGISAFRQGFQMWTDSGKLLRDPRWRLRESPASLLALNSGPSKRTIRGSSLFYGD